MTLEESQAEAARILDAAGWKADPGWGGFHHGTCIGGLAPNGSVYVKNWAAIQPGHPKYGPDTPDEPHEAAAWLVKHAAPKAYRFRRKGAATPPIDLADPTGVGEGLEGLGGADPIDADFSEPDNLPDLGQELSEEHPEEYGASGAFIFGDNLHQMRTAAIGLVVQAALHRLPASIDYARLSELRNFTMGVSEGRWPDNAANREELDTLEATERLRRQIEQVRDEKVAALLDAPREVIEGFDAEAGWP